MTRLFADAPAAGLRSLMVSYRVVVAIACSSLTAVWLSIAVFACNSICVSRVESQDPSRVRDVFGLATAGFFADFVGEHRGQLAGVAVQSRALMVALL